MPEESVSLDEIFSLLSTLGFTQYESKAYVALVRHGVCTAPALAEASRVPKSKIYSVLDSLMQKRVIEEYPGSPRRFRARPPRAVFEHVIGEEIDRLKDLSRRAERVASAIESMISRAEKNVLDRESVLWTVDGRRAFHEKFAEMGYRARERIIVVSPYFSRSPVMEDSIRAARERGVVFRTITSIKPGNKERVVFYLSLFDEVRHFDGEVPLTVVIIDDRECLYRLSYNLNGHENYVGVYSRNPGLVRAMEMYWEGLARDSVLVSSPGEVEHIAGRTG